MSAFTWPPEGPAATGGERSAPAGGPIQAAVLVPLLVRADTGQAELVLTRRRADLRRHAGEISFPGGRMDDEDVDLRATALREAEEEIGLVRTQVAVLGELPATSTFATNYVIHPFVGAIPQGLAWRMSAREVDEVLELAVEDLRAGRTRVQLERRGISFETDAFVVGEHLVWGATARIVEHLLQSSYVADAKASLAASALGAPAGNTGPHAGGK